MSVEKQYVLFLGVIFCTPDRGQKGPMNSGQSVLPSIRPDVFSGFAH